MVFELFCFATACVNKSACCLCSFPRCWHCIRSDIRVCRAQQHGSSLAVGICISAGSQETHGAHLPTTKARCPRRCGAPAGTEQTKGRQGCVNCMLMKCGLACNLKLYACYKLMKNVWLSYCNAISQNICF